VSWSNKNGHETHKWAWSTSLLYLAIFIICTRFEPGRVAFHLPIRWVWWARLMEYEETRGEEERHWHDLLPDNSLQTTRRQLTVSQVTWTSRVIPACNYHYGTGKHHHVRRQDGLRTKCWDTINNQTRISIAVAKKADRTACDVR